MSSRAQKIPGHSARELAFQIAYAADMAGAPALEMLDHFEARFVQARVEKGPDMKSRWYEIPAFEDTLPEPEAWQALRRDVLRHLEALDVHDLRTRELLRTASPRWRLDRMPAVDRSLLRLGVSEMLSAEGPPTRHIIHSQIELAKRYGGDTSHRFVNGILDQVRRDLALPFT